MINNDLNAQKTRYTATMSYGANYDKDGFPDLESYGSHKAAVDSALHTSTGQELQLAGIAGQLEAYLHIAVAMMQESPVIQDELRKFAQTVPPLLRKLQTMDRAAVYVRYKDLREFRTLLDKMLDCIGDPAFFFFDLVCETEKILWQISESPLPTPVKELVVQCQKQLQTWTKTLYRALAHGYTEYNMATVFNV